MSQRTHVFALCAAALVAACTDASQPTAPVAPIDRSSNALASATGLSGQRDRFVAIGTSISMGWASNGVFFGSQLVAWPELLSIGQLHPISLPLIQSPGCTSPLIAPLGNGKRLSGESFAGSTVCAANVGGVTLPTQNVALAGALTIDALTRTPEAAAVGDPPMPWYARVLPPGTTQVSAALAQQPTLVSVELGGNDILATTGGRVIPGVTYVPFPFWAAAFDAVLNAVGSAHSKGLILGMPLDGTNLPALRKGSEIWADALEFAALHVDVSPDCKDSPNYINVSVESLVLVFAAAFTSTHGLPNPVFSCADVGDPSNDDYVLTPSDITTLNTQLGQMAAYAKQQAAARGYAFFSIGALYDRRDLKPPKYSVISQLTSPIPYGPYISLDGVHPSPLGHTVLAIAAASALNATYGSIAAHAISAAPSLSEQLVEPTLPGMSLEWAKRVASDHGGQLLPACLMPGGCTLGAARGLR
jgi:lysophospholipase L1-like esterase